MIKVNDKAYSERVILASQCNFKCAYCYQKHKTHQLLSREIAKKRIAFIKNYIEEHPGNDVCLNLFGGEPLLNWDVFKLFIDELSDLEPVYLSTITNGSLLTDDKIAYLKDKRIKIHISLDGNAMSNLMRVGVNKKQTHPMLEEIIKKLIKNHIYFAVNMTLGKNNARFATQSLDYLKSLGVPEIHLQFMTYASYRINDDIIETIIKHAEDLQDKNFSVIIGLLKKADEIKAAQDSCLDKNSECEILYEKWTHTQANGFSYDFVGCIGTGFPDEMAFCLNKEVDYTKSNILSYYDNVTDEYVKLKDLTDL